MPEREQIVATGGLIADIQWGTNSGRGRHERRAWSDLRDRAEEERRSRAELTEERQSATAAGSVTTASGPSVA